MGNSNSDGRYVPFTQRHMVGTFLERQANAGRSAILSRETLLQGGSVLHREIKHAGWDHITTIRSKKRLLMVADIHLEPNSTLRDLRIRHRTIHVEISSSASQHGSRWPLVLVLGSMLVTLHAFSAAWEESMLYSLHHVPHDESPRLCSRLDRSGSVRRVLPHKMQSSATTLLCGFEQQRDFPRAIASHATIPSRPKCLQM